LCLEGSERKIPRDKRLYIGLHATDPPGAVGIIVDGKITPGSGSGGNPFIWTKGFEAFANQPDHGLSHRHNREELERLLSKFEPMGGKHHSPILFEVNVAATVITPYKWSAWPDDEPRVNQIVHLPGSYGNPYLVHQDNSDVACIWIDLDWPA
jgi:hypothetical protein